MKPNIHPDYHEITYVMTDGEERKTRSTWGKAGDKMRLDVDPKTHPAWNKGGIMVMENAGQMEKFKKRFGSFKMSGKSGGAPASNSASAKKDEKKSS